MTKFSKLKTFRWIFKKGGSVWTVVKNGVIRCKIWVKKGVNWQADDSTFFSFLMKELTTHVTWSRSILLTQRMWLTPKGGECDWRKKKKTRSKPSYHFDHRGTAYQTNFVTICALFSKISRKIYVAYTQKMSFSNLFQCSKRYISKGIHTFLYKTLLMKLKFKRS